MNLRDTANRLRGMLLRGEITYKEAITALRPVVAEADKKGAAIAKQYGKRYKKISINSLLR